MGIQEEYAAIATGMRQGTLPPAPEDTAPPPWISTRFSSSYLSTSGPGLAPGFGEQYVSGIRSSTAYSFGNCSRKDATKVFISQELAANPAISPGPLAYTLPTNVGPNGAAKTVSTKYPSAFFATDSRGSADLRELKACGVFEGTTVAGDLKRIRDRVHNAV